MNTYQRIHDLLLEAKKKPLDKNLAKRLRAKLAKQGKLPHRKGSPDPHEGEPYDIEGHARLHFGDK
jgi:hypothetical protein